MKLYKKIYIVLATLSLGFLGYGAMIFRKFTAPYIFSEQRKCLGNYCEVRTSDEIKLAAVLFERPHARRVFLICHGYHQVKEEMYVFADLFPQDTVMCFDFRAHGESAGSKISFGIHEYKDVLAVVDFLRSCPTTKKLPLYVIGISMGGAALLKAISQGAQIDAAVIDSSFSNLRAQLKFSLRKRTMLPFFLDFIALRVFEYFIDGSIDSVKIQSYGPQIQVPVLVFQDVADAIVPPESIEQIFNALGSPLKQNHRLSGTRHGWMFREHSDEYVQMIESFGIGVDDFIRCASLNPS
jgi:Lysophospholipase